MTQMQHNVLLIIKLMVNVLTNLWRLMIVTQLKLILMDIAKKMINHLKEKEM